MQNVAILVKLHYMLYRRVLQAVFLVGPMALMLLIGINLNVGIVIIALIIMCKIYKVSHKQSDDLSQFNG